MKILFMSLINITSIKKRGIYTDLLRQLSKDNHEINILSPVNEKNKESVYKISNVTYIQVYVGDIQKTNLLKKGINTLLLERRFIKAIKNYCSNIQFDLVLYSTPPITFLGTVEYVKKRDNSKTYLMLKDIFPQNAVDLGMIKTKGISGIIYKFFRKKEKKLYQISDTIGCMSPANIEYLLKHNTEIDKQKVELFPNCIEPIDVRFTLEEKLSIRKKFNIPIDKTIFLYGGNLGKPQGIDFLLSCIQNSELINNAFFIIVGSGVESSKIKKYIREKKPRNLMFLEHLPQSEYRKIVFSSDIGLIFLDKRFTIPNFPSRVLSYMEASLPIIACTDPISDIGKIACENYFGWMSISENPNDFVELINNIQLLDLNKYGINSRNYLEENYHVKKYYKLIINSYFKNK